MNDSIRFLKNSYEDILYESKRILASLEEIGVNVQEKLDHPYSQSEFISFERSLPHA